MTERIASQVTSIHNVVMLGLLLGAGLSGSIGGSSASVSDTLAQRVHGGRIAAEAAPMQLAAAPATFNAKVDAYYEQLRTKLRWLPVRFAGDVLQTPDAQSRLLLVQSAAQRAGLDKVGLGYADVYGIINAETSWIPRMGASKDGTPNLGIAQFEPATARAVGLTDPLDPVQAVHAAAMHLKDAARWSSRRIANLKLTPEEHATKLREGVSIYYNLSSKGRSTWNGLNTAKLPIETRRHIANARVGAREAADLELQLVQLKSRMTQPAVMTASFQGNGG